MLHNLIRINNPDIPIYRTFPFGRFREVLLERSLALVAPSLWDDPFENFLIRCAITYIQDGKWRQDFFDRIRKPVYGQCWSLAAESDALWRIYSKVDKDQQTGRNRVVEYEGVKVRTTARKLLGALWETSPIEPSDACFLGQVEYMPQEAAAQCVADEVGRARLKAFDDGLGHARALLIKSEPFDHEREVRLIFVELREGYGNKPVFPIGIDPNALFEEVVLDPRLHGDDVRDREEELRSLGYNGRVTKSDLYQGVLYEIVLR